MTNPAFDGRRLINLGSMTDTELLRLIDSPNASPEARQAAVWEWQDREEQRARNSAVASWINGMNGRG